MNEPKDGSAEKIAIDLTALAPPYRERVHGFLFVGYYVALAISLLPAAIGHSASFVYPLAYVGPVAIFVLATWYSGSSSRKIRTRYVPELLSEAGLPLTQGNRELAAAALKKQRSSSTLARDASLTTILVLWVAQTRIFWSHHSLDFGSFGGGLESVGSCLLYVLLLLLSTFVGVIPSLLVRQMSGTLKDLRDTASVSRLRLKESDRNDLQLVQVSVALQSVHRRVETYTLESTFLSALAFSAFMAMVYSERGPIEGVDWLVNLNWICAASLSFACAPQISVTDLTTHAMFIIAAFLLACSVFFLSVLLTRLRFNDAFRHAEEIVRAAEALNDKENAESSRVQSAFTQEIRRLIDRGQEGVDDLNPMVSFMKLFRELGIFAFMFAIATCGLYFHWMVSAAIILLFLSALCFGYVDKMRRRSSFLPTLENTVLHVIRRGGQ